MMAVTARRPCPHRQLLGPGCRAQRLHPLAHRRVLWQHRPRRDTAAGSWRYSLLRRWRRLLLVRRTRLHTPRRQRGARADEALHHRPAGRGRLCPRRCYLGPSRQARSKARRVRQFRRGGRLKREVVALAAGLSGAHRVVRRRRASRHRSNRFRSLPSQQPPRCLWQRGWWHAHVRFVWLHRRLTYIRSSLWGCWHARASSPSLWVAAT